MKNLTKTVLVLSFILVPQQSKAATWGPKELLAASEAAMAHFKETMGSALYESVTGISVELNAQKIAAKAKITYVEANTPKTKNLFCHEHTDTIDCH